jgi:2-keto-4-pentenoate hydratase
MSNVAEATILSLADTLWGAELTRSPVPPLTVLHPDLTVEDAYAIATHNINRRVAVSGAVRGRRVGMTSRASQNLFGVSEPNFGALLPDMFLDDGAEIACETLIQPRIQAEFAFVMATDLAGPGVSTIDALLAILGVIPAIGVVDSRIADWQIKIQDTVADNGSAARVVLGPRVFPVLPLDLCHLGVLFYRNGSPIESGAGAAVLGNPARCVAWLANKLGALGGGLRAGDTVLSGALHRMVPVRPGDSFRADFAHIGSVSVQFSRTPT